MRVVPKCEQPRSRRFGGKLLEPVVRGDGGVLLRRGGGHDAATRGSGEQDRFNARDGTSGVTLSRTAISGRRRWHGCQVEAVHPELGLMRRSRVDSWLMADILNRCTRHFAGKLSLTSNGGRALFGCAWISFFRPGLFSRGEVSLSGTLESLRSLIERSTAWGRRCYCREP